MNASPFRNRSILAGAIGAVLMFGLVSQATAQTARERAERRERAESRQNDDQEVVEKYANATRENSKQQASSRLAKPLNKLIALHEEGKSAEARAAAEEIIANERANAYERAIAAQIAAHASYEAEDNAAAMDYLRQALEFDGLDNNNHFNSMLMLGQMQLQQEQYEQAIATFDRYLAESGSDDPEALALKGNALYAMERYPEAADALKRAMEASPEPRADWMQMLMAAYAETGQTAEAARLAEQIASKSPDDKRSQLNLAAIYQQSDMPDEAAAVLERVRAAGQLTDEAEYRQLYATYLNLEGKEREAAEVINEGLQKGALKEDFNTYLALAQAYYFSDQIDPAIEAYRKAGPLDDDGETFLNLARVLWQEDRIGEAKAAAQQALDKGLGNPEDARKILALPGN
ncbi:MAG: tetratricopeptide repeat protein [Proteobacteria bacterium]|nr:tetratricopeptide repeat protein [Pseudomonadota bacterium]